MHTTDQTMNSTKNQLDDSYYHLMTSKGL